MLDLSHSSLSTPVNLACSRSASCASKGRFPIVVYLRPPPPSPDGGTGMATLASLLLMSRFCIIQNKDSFLNF